MTEFRANGLSYTKEIKQRINKKQKSKNIKK